MMVECLHPSQDLENVGAGAMTCQSVEECIVWGFSLNSSVQKGCTAGCETMKATQR